MKVVKPQKLGVIARPFEYERRFFLGIGLLSLQRLEGAMASEVDMWSFLAQELGKDGAPDAGLPKPRGEFLVTGYAFRSERATDPASVLRVQIGEMSKTLYAFGDRYWTVDRLIRSVISPPEEFDRISVSWENAFGGPGFARNPVGKGMGPAHTEEGTAYPLPNIELPDHLISSTSDRPDPAGFGPIDILWPQRASKAGTYDAAWLEERFPGFAGDMDWSFFNIAPVDQQQEQPFLGNETFAIEGMHPEQTRLEGRLPGIVARCFLNLSTPEGDVFEEVPTRLTTVWFFPHAMRYLLVSHGWREVREEDATDVLQLLAAVERQGQPRPVDHYREVLAKRLDPERGMVHSLNESDLLPADLPEVPDAASAEMSALMETENLLRKHQRIAYAREIEKRRSFLRDLGLDPDLHGPKPLPPEEPPPRLEEIPDLMERLTREGEERMEVEKQRMIQRKEALRPLLEAEGLDAEAILAESDQPVTGPPRFSAAREVEKLRALSEELRAMGTPVEEIDRYAEDPERNRMLVEAEQNMREAYRLAADLQGAPARFSGDEGARARAAALATLASQGHLARANLTGFDLSDLDLRGIDLSGAWLENANLARSNLEGANLSEAVLARADLTDAILSGADLRKSNLGLAQMARTRADGADLSEGILRKARLDDASFEAARFDGADLGELEISGTDLTGASLAGAIFLKNQLKELRLRGADLAKATFLEVDLSGADFTGANLGGATFVTVKGPGAVFAGARLDGARFVKGCAFEGADFSGAILERANLRETELSGANFGEATLGGADLSGCDLSGASLYRAQARDALFAKADLSRAQLASADLMNATLQSANLSGADLRGANLYQANLARVLADDHTNFERSNRKKARVLPERSRA